MNPELARRFALRFYVLDGHTPVPEPEVETWATWMYSADADDRRRVAVTLVEDVRVSTVFLGFDHSHSLYGPPMLFETMVFGGQHGGYQRRYATWEQAERGHHRAVAMLDEFPPVPVECQDCGGLGHLECDHEPVR